jgi:hypothetical protein
MQTVAQSNHCYIHLTHCPDTMRKGSDKHKNKKERDRKCLPPMQVSLQPTQSCQQRTESVSNKYIHKAALQSEGFFFWQ